MIGIFYIRSNRYDDKTSDDFCCSGGSGVYERRCCFFIFVSADGEPGHSGVGKALQWSSF